MGHSRREIQDRGVKIEGKPGLWAYDNCERCGGCGRYSFNPVDGDICYGCYGSGKGPMVRVDEKYIQKLERDAQKREDKKEKERSEIDRHIERTLQNDQELAEAMKFTEDRDNDKFCNGFIADIASKFFRFGSLSEKQRNAFVKAVNKSMALKEEDSGSSSNPVPTGKVQVIGVVKKAYYKETAYGSRHVMIVEGDGWKVWGSVPSSISSVDTEDRVSFTANVEASDTDPSFGFFKRPTRAKILEVYDPL